LSVVATSHAAVAFTQFNNDVTAYIGLINTGAVAVAVRITQDGAAARLPVDGTPGDFVLPPLMQFPIVLPCGFKTPQITAIGAAAGPSLIYATPLESA
jgi:hypothetical protein